MNGSKLKRFFIFCLVCCGISIPQATISHTGHSLPPPPVEKYDPSTVLRLLKTGKNFEVVALVPKDGGTWTIYVSDPDSNRPIADGSISILLNDENKYEASKTDKAGVYQSAIPLKAFTKLSFFIKSNHLEDTLSFDNIKLSVAQGNFPSSLPLEATVLLAILGIIVFRRRLKSIFFLSLGIPSAFLTSSICLAHGGDPHTPVDEKQENKEQHGQQEIQTGITNASNELFIPKEVQFQLRVITEKVIEREVSGTARLIGHVISDPSGYARLQASQNARVLNDPDYPLPLTGQKVQKDQVILALQPTFGKIESSDQKSMLYKIESEIIQLKKDVYRKEQLGQYASKKDLENARTDLDRAIKQKEEIINKTFKPEYLKSPLKGIIADLHVRPGEVVTPDKTIVEIVDPSKLLVEALVFDAQTADNLTGGIARLPLLPDKSIRLKILGVSPKVSKEDQAIHVLFQAEELDPSIKLDMAVEVLGNLRTSKPSLTVPKKAVMKDTKGTWVFIHSAPEIFETRRVRIRRIIEDWAEIEEGLVAGEKVVVDGAYLLNQAK